MSVLAPFLSCPLASPALRLPAWHRYMVLTWPPQTRGLEVVFLAEDFQLKQPRRRKPHVSFFNSTCLVYHTYLLWETVWIYEEWVGGWICFNMLAYYQRYQIHKEKPVLMGWWWCSRVSAATYTPTHTQLQKITQQFPESETNTNTLEHFYKMWSVSTTKRWS